MNRLFTIVIPTLNEEKFLPHLLFDLEKQRFKEFDVIIVDGQSTDSTKKIALGYKDKMALAYVSVRKRNVSYQRNYGAKLSKGAYMVFLDADTRIGANFLSSLKKEIEKTGNLVYIPAIYPQNHSFQDKMLFKIINFIIEASQYTKRPFSSSGSMVIEHKFFEHLHGFDDKLFVSEDHDIVQRAKAAGVTSRFMETTPIQFSLRRFEREGRLDVFKKYVTITMHNIRKGRIEKKILEYNMGGDFYNDTAEKSLSLEEQVAARFRHIKARLDKLT